MKKLSDENFEPTLIHPFYNIRTGLKKGVTASVHHLHGKMLDFGCGSKPYQQLINVEQYVGVDFENPGHPHDEEQIDVYYDGKQLPFEDSTFDSVLCSEVFEHVFNLNDILREINRVAKPDAKMVVTCPFVWNEHEAPYDYARYTRFALKDLLERNGFEIVSYSKSGNFITAVTQMITLYFFHRFKGVWRKFFLLRLLYKFCFFLVPNVAGNILQRILPFDDTLYLSNIVVARKK